MENVNDELDVGVCYLNVLISTLKLGSISKIVQIGYLMQNFKKAIIQNRDPHEASPAGGHAELRVDGTVQLMLVYVMYVTTTDCEIYTARLRDLLS